MLWWQWYHWVAYVTYIKKQKSNEELQSWRSHKITKKASKNNPKLNRNNNSQQTYKHQQMIHKTKLSIKFKSSNKSSKHHCFQQSNQNILPIYRASPPIHFCGGSRRTPWEIWHHPTDQKSRRFIPYNPCTVILLMEEILHHLGCTKPCR